MSSHHIVRENQEPALLVQYFNTLDSENLGQILEWSPTIITDVYNLDYFLAEEIKVDILFGQIEEELIQEKIKILPIETSFIEDALSYLIHNNYKAVNVLLDTSLDVLIPFADKINIVAFYGQRRYVLIQNQFEKWKPAGEKIYISDRFIKSFVGLNFVEKDVFQVEQDGFVRIEFNTNEFVLLGEDI